LANAASKVPKIGWLNLLTVNGFISVARYDFNALWMLGEMDIYGEAVDDMDPSDTGSHFLDDLNSRAQSSNVEYYGIIGIVGSFMNRSISGGDYYGGDCIISKDSQLGSGYVSYKEWVQIKANHWNEIKVSSEGTISSILSFLDSTPPEFEITSPDPAGTTEISEASVHIQGKVYKEYLPADSTLSITVQKQEGGYDPPAQTSLLKPSDLWLPNNPDSPVAEFDEIVNFPAQGTYKISCQVKNPAGVVSQMKDIWVKVTTIVAQGTKIIVHCHNPEGVEIASIQGMERQGVEIYDGDSLIGYGAYDSLTHNQPISISGGTHTIKAKFNGMTEEKIVALNPNETQTLIFVFPRTSVSSAELFDIPETDNSNSVAHVINGASWGWKYCASSSPFSIDNQIHYGYPSWGTAEIHMSVQGKVSCNTVSYSLEGTASSTVVNFPPNLYGDCKINSLTLTVSPIAEKWVTLPRDVTFNYWYIQNNSTKVSEAHVFLCQDPWGYYADLVQRWQTGYYIYTADTTYNWAYVRFDLDGISKTISSEYAYELTVSDSASFTLTLETLKFSSVPYDLTGSGV
jgi:hypothetical protein